MSRNVGSQGRIPYAIKRDMSQLRIGADARAREPRGVTARSRCFDRRTRYRTSCNEVAATNPLNDARPTAVTGLP
jgi:hypothetical protein